MSGSDSPITIKVDTQYLPQQSDEAQAKYVFSYTITIINTGDQDITLKDRHWIITDANGDQNEVKGPGVVGETPTIAPNTAYQYSSGTVMETPIGFMQGSYGMVYADGRALKAPIPPFRLAIPGIMQ